MTISVPLVVVADDSPEGRSIPLPSALTVLFEREGAATRAFGNRAHPQAYVVDEAGLVLDRRVPGSRGDLAEMARLQQGGRVGAPGAER